MRKPDPGEPSSLENLEQTEIFPEQTEILTKRTELWKTKMHNLKIKDTFFVNSIDKQSKSISEACKRQ